MTQADLAKKVRVSATAVTDWETGKSRPWENLVALAQALKSTTDWLLTGEGSAEGLTVEKLLDQSEFKPGAMPQMHKLPVLGKAAANYKSTHVKTTEWQLADVKYSRQNHYVLVAHGHSMKPTIFEGDRCVVQAAGLVLEEYDEMKGPADKRAWLNLNEEIVVAIVNDEDQIVKRFFAFEDHKGETGFNIYLQSDNRKVPPIIVRRDTHLRIVGVVKEILRNPKNYE